MSVLSELRDRQVKQRIERERREQLNPLKTGTITGIGDYIQINVQGKIIDASSLGGAFVVGECVRVIMPSRGMAAIKKIVGG
jgi:hypothetical protein